MAKNGIWSKNCFREIDLFGEIDLFDFTSFLAWTFFKFQAHYVQLEEQIFLPYLMIFEIPQKTRNLKFRVPESITNHHACFRVCLLLTKITL